MKKIYKSFLVLACLCMAVSCKDKEKKEEPAPTFTELISKHTWRLSAQTNSYSGTTHNTFLQKESCEQDDIRQFKSDKTYLIDEGSVKCNPGRPSVLDEGIWEISGDKLSLTSNRSQGEPAEFRITELTDKKLVYTTSYTSFDVTFTETFTFVPQK